jgi:hypothetical protein
MTDFYKELVAKLTNPKKQKPYKESSVKPVYRYLTTLNGSSPPTSLDFLLERPVVMKFLEKYAVGTQRTIVFAIRNIAKDFDRDDILDVWKGNIEETEAGKGVPEKNVKSEAQQKAYAMLEGDDKGSAWDTILKKAEKYAEGHSDNPYILSQIYTLFPPRRNLDYSEMKLVADYDPSLSKEFNYLVAGVEKQKGFADVMYKGKPYRVEIKSEDVFERVPKTRIHKKVGNVGMAYFSDMEMPKEEKMEKVGMRFVFNRYKTDGVYNQQIFNVPDDLAEHLQYFIKSERIQEEDFLITSRTGKKYDSEEITEALHKVFGAGISSQMLRHIYLDKYNTPERESVIREMMGDAEKMAHSISMQQNTYVKK